MAIKCLTGVIINTIIKGQHYMQNATIVASYNYSIIKIKRQVRRLKMQHMDRKVAEWSKSWELIRRQRTF